MSARAPSGHFLIVFASKCPVSARAYIGKV